MTCDYAVHHRSESLIVLSRLFRGNLNAIVVLPSPPLIAAVYLDSYHNRSGEQQTPTEDMILSVSFNYLEKMSQWNEGVERAQRIRWKYSCFRVLIMGRANAGKTTILQKICNTIEQPEIYDVRHQKVQTYEKLK